MDLSTHFVKKLSQQHLPIILLTIWALTLHGSYLHEETGANEAEIALCYSIAKEVFQMPETWSSIVALDNKIPAAVQTEMLYQLRRTVRRATRWFLRHRNKAQTIEQAIEFFALTFADLVKT